MPLAFLARLGADGQLDPSFGQSGLAPQPGLGLITDLQVEPSGASAFTATPAGCALPRDGFLARLGADGHPDRGFGLGGRSRLAEPPGSAPHRRFVLQRLEADGSPDPRFGKRGRVTTGFGARARSKARAIMLAPRGRILLAGSLGASYLVNETGFALASYRP
ncbi:MAG: hypothetical protein QOF06_1240 [Solirubrobacterales bacterium]|jgi:hypothetical protein|nr:hypothetical protein [Solirubrobacterales bacterium]